MPLPILESYIDLVSISLFDGECPEQVRTFRDASRLAKASLSELPLTTFVYLPKTSTSISFEDIPMIKIISHLKRCQRPIPLFFYQTPFTTAISSAEPADAFRRFIFLLGVLKQHARRFIGCLTLPTLTELHVSDSVTLDVQIFVDLICRSKRVAFALVL